MAQMKVGPESGADVPCNIATEDRGAFRFAVCHDCGWRGPGRRSRRIAGVDAAEHAAACTETPATMD